MTIEPMSMKRMQLVVEGSTNKVKTNSTEKSKKQEEAGIGMRENWWELLCCYTSFTILCNEVPVIKIFTFNNLKVLTICGSERPLRPPLSFNTGLPLFFI